MYLEAVQEGANMCYIFVDCEMQSIEAAYKKERTVCSREIIELGAVMLDNVNYREVASFKEYVKPSYAKRISPKITSLTGITQSKVMGAAAFNEVFLKFVSWCRASGERFVVYAWSECDLEQVTKEMQLKKTVKTADIEEVLGSWVDFQEEYGGLVKADRKLGLKDAVDLTGQPFIGRQHDALCDARNTSELFRLSRNPNELSKLRSSMKYMTGQGAEGYSSTLGDAFDFSSFCFA